MGSQIVHTQPCAYTCVTVTIQCAMYSITSLCISAVTVWEIAAMRWGYCLCGNVRLSPQVPVQLCM